MIKRETAWILVVILMWLGATGFVEYILIVEGFNNLVPTTVAMYIPCYFISQWIRVKKLNGGI